MCKKHLILLLSIIALLILGFPLVVYGIDKTFFYSIDPDVVYITNALLYAKYAIISYADHPGTPTIMLLNYCFFPLRLIVKYFLHQNFIQWSFDNFAFLMYYSRIFELIIFCTSLYLFVKAIFKSTKSYLIGIFAWLSVFVFMGFGWGIRVVPENFSFFLTGVWLLVFSKFIVKRSYLYCAIMTLIAGFAVANKFTALFLLVPSLFLPIFIGKLKIDQLYARIQLNVIIAGLAFYIGILPAIEQFPWIKSFATMLFFHSGTHGTGTVAFLDWTTYSSSVLSLITGHPVAFTYICLTIALAIYLLIKKKIKFKDPVLFLLLTTLVGIFVFAKYTTIHYQYVNFALMIFCAAYLLIKIDRKYLKFILVILSVLLIFNFWGSQKSISNQLMGNRTETVYSVLKSWTPFWAADIFREQLDAVNPVKL